MSIGLSHLLEPLEMESEDSWRGEDEDLFTGIGVHHLLLACNNKTTSHWAVISLTWQKRHGHAREDLYT